MALEEVTDDLSIGTAETQHLLDRVGRDHEGNVCTGNALEELCLQQIKIMVLIYVNSTHLTMEPLTHLIAAGNALG